MDTLNIKGVEILRGGRVGFAMFFSFHTNKASCLFFNVVQLLDLFEMELEFWRMSVGNVGKMKDK